MTSVADIKQAILNLPEEECAEVIDWLYSLEEEEWDRQIGEDAAAGRLDFLMEEARSAEEQGALPPL